MHKNELYSKTVEKLHEEAQELGDMTDNERAIGRAKALREAIRETLLQRRLDLGLTQKEVGARMGTTQAHVSSIERRGTYDISLIMRCATVLDLDYRALLDGTGEVAEVVY